jgi:hypothetical protein
MSICSRAAAQRAPWNRLQLAAGCLLLLSLASAGYAGEGAFYTGMTSGTAVLEATAPRSSESVLAYTMFGGYRLGKHVSLEASRTSFGAALPLNDDLLAVTSSERVATWGLCTVGVVPLGRVSLFGRVGLLAPDALGGVGALTDVARLGRVYGVGVSYRPIPEVELRLESERMTRIDEAAQTDATVLRFGASVRF